MKTLPDEDDAAANENNLGIFVDCLTVVVAQKLNTGNSSNSGARRRRGGKGRKNEIKPVVRPESRIEDDAAELGDFIEVRERLGLDDRWLGRAETSQYLAREIFAALPLEVRGLSYAAVQDDKQLETKYETPLDGTVLEELVNPLPAPVLDSLCSYGLIESPPDVDRFLEPVLSAYMTSATAPLPEFTPSLSESRPDGCEICEREHLPLTYHHLIPRQVHAKAVKRGWHSEWELNKVAWLCRACHSYVHKIASNEELARELYSVGLLMEREDVRKWAAWVGRVRWKAK